ncbi:BA14K family protein [Gellertiella hungarica]|uniref:Lectin-like protein BA14k n=1 Tax=Gellertiella hungarica TaxID=1572859 RepID=A0A7W6J263_9HYPH|nr:BA14K family protein [Gellertiella hungarica]MBB4063421.1 hypothetical protein [Gellertiella hungarica]
MTKLFKTLVISATIAATALVSAGTASADGWRRHHHSDGDAVAAGVAGLAVGAILGSALSSPPRRTYVEDYPVYDEPVYDEPTYVYRTNRVIVEQPTYVERRRVVVEQPGLRPWTQSWLRYCSQRYRTFDPSTGTFVGYDGQEHFCRG